VARNYPAGGPLDEAEGWVGTNVVVFMGFVAAGSAYIILAKLWGIDAFLVTFVPVAIMVVYALLIVLARGLRLRDDQSGDNLYYMGFLFTLTSLGVSLYQFSAQHAAEEIVRNFGIAIGSTIAGIGLRVIFNQMRRDPVEVEHASRLELAEAARRVRRELDSSVVEFGYFRRTAQQSAADSFSHMAERFDDIVGKLVASLETLTTKLVAPLEAAARQLDGSTGDLTRTMGATLAASAEQLSVETDKLSGRVGAIAGALDDVFARLHSLQTPDGVFESQLEPMLHSLTQAIDRIAAHSDAQTRSVSDALAIANSAADRSIDLVNAMRQDFEATSNANRATLEWAMAMIKATAEVLDEIKVSSHVYTEGLTFMLEKTEQVMQTFTEVVVNSGAEAALRTDRLSEALPAIESRARSLAIAADRIAGVVEELRARPKRPEREVIE
jgi:hypothetical protein